MRPNDDVAAVFAATATVTADGTTTSQETSGFITAEFLQLGFDQAPPKIFDLLRITTIALSAQRTLLRVRHHQLEITLEDGTGICLSQFTGGSASPDELFAGLTALAIDRRLADGNLNDEAERYLRELRGGQHVHADEQRSGYRLALDLTAPRPPDAPGQPRHA